MSVPLMPTERTPGKDRASQWRRRGARLSRPGAALTARGEPTLWLTAGALAIALFMIFGLVSLVVIMGGRTFWPDRLTQVELIDGSKVLGNVVETEPQLLTQAEFDALPASAKNQLKDQASPEVTRTLFRTDNKQLTGETYRWVDNILISPGGTTHPEWATTIERLSWGRFLGTPDAFIVRTPRRPTGIEEQLAKLIAFFESNRASVDEAQQPVIDKGIEQLAAELEQVKERATSAFLEMRRPSTHADERIVVLESGEEIPLTDANASNAVVALREVWTGPETSWKQYLAWHDDVRDRTEQIRDLDEHELGHLSDQLEDARMQTVRSGLQSGQPLEAAARQLADLDSAASALKSQRDSLRQILDSVKRTFPQSEELVRITNEIVQRLDQDVQAQVTSINEEIAGIESGFSQVGLAAINDYREVAADTRAKTIDVSDQIAKLRSDNEPYAWRLVTADGTSQEIPLAEIVRAIPSNRLGTFGRIQVYLSRWKEFLFAEPREANTEGGVFPAIWGTIAMTLIMTVAVVPFGVLAALYLREYAKAGIIVSAVRIAVNNLAGVPSIVFGVFGLGFFCYVVGAGIDETFYPEYVAQNKPVFGTGGLLWASLTLALLTLPVVIVATEEALAAVPNSMREGSYACGASKWQTIRRIILPRALPGIMTGMILAMARGAGEVAPLMLVGAVKIAPALPVDASAPFVHPSRSFMHLGFHIYDLGFQSPDSEAAKPMVFTTTLLLISIVAILNIAAIALRNRLRKRFAASQF